MAKKKAASSAKKAAKASKVNKSQAVRDYYEANPDAKPRDVVEGLAKKGIQLNAAYVSVVRSNSKKSPSVKRGVGRPSKRGKGTDAVSLDSLLRVKEIVEEVGGIEQAHAALKALDQLTN